MQQIIIYRFPLNLHLNTWALQFANVEVQLILGAPQLGQSSLQAGKVQIELFWWSYRSGRDSVIDGVAGVAGDGGDRAVDVVVHLGGGDGRGGGVVVGGGLGQLQSQWNMHESYHAFHDMIA